MRSQVSKRSLSVKSYQSLFSKLTAGSNSRSKILSSWRLLNRRGRRSQRAAWGVTLPTLRYLRSAGWRLEVAELQQATGMIEYSLSPGERVKHPRRLPTYGVWLGETVRIPVFLLAVSSWAEHAEFLRRATLGIARRHVSGACLVIAQHCSGVGVLVAEPLESAEGSIKVAVTARPNLPIDQVRALKRELTEQTDAHRELALLSTTRLLLKRIEAPGRFLRELGPTMKALDHAWIGLPAEAIKTRRRLSLKLVIRLIFLLLIQERGWLGGDRLYLDRLLREHRTAPPASLYREYLAPLFFGVLNTPVNERDPEIGRLPRVAEIPYLNGGLFALSEDEQQLKNLDVDADIVAGLLTSLHLKYRFQLEETGDDDEVLNPVVLGSVFERWMSSLEREKDGAFYTPPALVDEVVDDAMLASLSQRGLTDAWERVKAGGGTGAERAELTQAICALRILDPACGSGAFLLGVWSWLLNARERLSSATQAELPALRRRWARDIVETQLFGIDRSDVAVRLSELRLWLALVSVELGSVEHVEPLPALRHRIRCADALSGPSSLLEGDNLLMSQSDRLRIRQATDRWLRSRGVERLAAERAVVKTERAVLERVWMRRLRAIRDENRGEQAGFAETGWQTNGQVRVAADIEIQEALEALKEGSELRSFDAHVHFAEVMEAGGFDIVIGNPPWIQLHRLPASRRRSLRRRYRWLSPPQALPRARGKQGDGDLSVAFAEQGWRWLRPKGVMALLLPSKVLRAPYGRALRFELGMQGDVTRLRDLVREGSGHSFGATCYPALVIASSSTTKPRERQPVVTGPSSAPKSTRFRDLLADPNDLSSAWTWGTKAGLTWSGPLLGDFMRSRLGIKTGANSVFVKSEPQCEGPWLPVIRGRDFGDQPTMKLLLCYDTRSGARMEAVEPAVQRWLDAFHVKLQSRRDAKDGDPPWTLFRIRPEMMGWRVAWPDISKRLEAAALPPVADGGALLLNTLYYLPAPDAKRAHRLAAVLSSKIYQLLTARLAPQAAGGHQRHFSYVIEALPFIDEFLEAAPTNPHIIELDELIAWGRTSGAVQYAVRGDRVDELVELILRSSEGGRGDGGGGGSAQLSLFGDTLVTMEL